MTRITYTERAQHCQNAIAKKIFTLLDEKKTNLALSADVTSARALLDLAETLGPEICIFKTHMDIVNDFTPDLIQRLTAIANKHHFLIFEDRKFADIGNTVKHQYQGGVHRIADWADIINAHSLPGPGIISGLKEARSEKLSGLLLLAEMSSANNLLNPEYTHKTLEMAEAHPDFVIGFIAQHKLSDHPQWLYMTPGVQLSIGKDSLGQQYLTPEVVIKQNGGDIIIVGRGILTASDPITEAKKYRKAGWDAYRDSF